MISFPTTRGKPGWLSILPQRDTVTLTHVVRSRGARPEVRLFENFAAPGGEVDALQRLRTTRRLKSYACTSLMASGEYSLVQMDAPPVPKEERKEALRWSLREFVSFPVDSACLDVLDIPAEGLPPGRLPGVLVAAASEAAVRARAAPFVAAKVRLDAIDLPELAQRNVAALLEDAQRGLVFLRIDESGLMLTLNFHAELVAVRRAEIHSGQLAGADAARTRARLALELQRSLDGFDRQYGHISISRVVLACHPEIAGLAEELSENVAVPVSDLDLADALDFSAVPELRGRESQTKHLLALGAALRGDEVGA